MVCGGGAVLVAAKLLRHRKGLEKGGKRGKEVQVK